MEKIEFTELLLQLSKEIGLNKTQEQKNDMQKFSDEHKRLFEENEQPLKEATVKQEAERESKQNRVIDISNPNKPFILPREI